jgi:hypothetical protein
LKGGVIPVFNSTINGEVNITGDDNGRRAT